MKSLRMIVPLSLVGDEVAALASLVLLVRHQDVLLVRAPWRLPPLAATTRTADKADGGDGGRDREMRNRLMGRPQIGRCAWHDSMPGVSVQANVRARKSIHTIGSYRLLGITLSGTTGQGLRVRGSCARPL
jgi:hypothetical protein